MIITVTVHSSSCIRTRASSFTTGGCSSSSSNAQDINTTDTHTGNGSGSVLILALSVFVSCRHFASERNASSKTNSGDGCPNGNDPSAGGFQGTYEELTLLDSEVSCVAPLTVQLHVSCSIGKFFVCSCHQRLLVDDIGYLKKC